MNTSGRLIGPDLYCVHSSEKNAVLFFSLPDIREPVWVCEWRACPVMGRLGLSGGKTWVNGATGDDNDGFPSAAHPYSHLIEGLKDGQIKFFNPQKLDDPRYGEFNNI